METEEAAVVETAVCHEYAYAVLLSGNGWVIGERPLKNERPKSLFGALRVGRIRSPNRIIMSSLARARAKNPGAVPTEIMARHYAQRSSAGLIISEGAHVSVTGNGGYGSPGIYSNSQMVGWKQVHEAVGAANGRMFVQLTHAGRLTHTSLTSDIQPVAPSAVGAAARVWIRKASGELGLEQSSHPRAMYLADIETTINQFGLAASNACNAGFEGVEIEAGAGALVEQFLRKSSNIRTDHYGNSIDNRIRFAREIVEAVAERIGSDRVGVRVSPFLAQHGRHDSRFLVTVLSLIRELNKLGIAYVHLSESNGVSAPYVDPVFRRELRSSFSGALIVGGYYTDKSAQRIIDDGLADAVSFGRDFIANPDLPYRLEKSFSLNAISNPFTVRGGGAHGYTDYPVYSKTELSSS